MIFYGKNLNQNMKLVQEFTRLPSGEWVLSVDDLVVELVLFDFLQKGVAIRTTRLSGHEWKTRIHSWCFR